MNPQKAQGCVPKPEFSLFTELFMRIINNKLNTTINDIALHALIFFLFFFCLYFKEKYIFFSLENPFSVKNIYFKKN